MLEQALFVAISTAVAVIGSVLGGFIISKKLKSDLKAELITFLSSDDAPKLVFTYGQVFGQGLFSKAGGLNPMKGNINIMGMKIPKVIAFGFAKKMGWLGSLGLPQQTNEGVGTSPPNPFAQIQEANR